MSLNPAIGKGWIHKHWKDVYVARDGIIKAGGRRIKAPRYYDKELAKIAPGLLIDKKDERRIAAQAAKKDTTPERLKTREAVALANQKRTENFKL
jgi:hypothetical protein